VLFYNYAEFSYNLCDGFSNMKVLIFFTFGLKMPINALKIGVFSGFDLLNGEHVKSDPKTYLTVMERRHLSHQVLKFITGIVTYSRHERQYLLTNAIYTEMCLFSPMLTAVMVKSI